MHQKMILYILLYLLNSLINQVCSINDSLAMQLMNLESITYKKLQEINPTHYKKATHYTDPITQEKMEIK